MTITKEQADAALKGLAALAKGHPNADALEYVRHETVVSYIEQLEAENKRLRELAAIGWSLSTWAACINWRGGTNEKEWLNDLKEIIERYQAEHKSALTQTDGKVVQND